MPTGGERQGLNKYGCHMAITGVVGGSDDRWVT